MSTSVNAQYSQSYYYRSFYTSNRNARLSSNRSHYSSDALIKADCDALKKAAKKLSDFDYTSENGKDIYNSILAFADTYNNALSSSGEADNHDVSRLRKSIKNLTSKEKKELEAVGITVKNNGSLEIDKDTLSSSRLDRIKKIFSKESSFTTGLAKYARSLYRAEEKANLNAATKKAASSLLSAANGSETAEETALGRNVDISL